MTEATLFPDVGCEIFNLGFLSLYARHCFIIACVLWNGKQLVGDSSAYLDEISIFSFYVLCYTAGSTAQLSEQEFVRPEVNLRLISPRTQLGTQQSMTLPKVHYSLNG